MATRGKRQPAPELPEFTYFHCTPDQSEYMELAATWQPLDVLVSGWRLLESGRGGPIWRKIDQARSVFLDSGVISLLKAAKKALVQYPKVSKLVKQDGAWTWTPHPNGLYRESSYEEWEAEYEFHFYTKKHIDSWLSQTERLEQTAWRLYRAGVTHGYAAMLDHPCEPDLLAFIGRTVDQAVDLTIRNAWTWYADVTLPPGWKKVYVSQGWDLEDYERCLEAYEAMGIIDEVHSGEAWLAAGTTCMRRPEEPEGPGLFEVYDFHRGWLGPDGHLHGLGLAQPEWIHRMRDAGQIDSADSSTASHDVAFNKWPYRVEGSRTQAVVTEQFAKRMLLMQAQVMATNGQPNLLHLFHVHRNQESATE